MSTIQEVARQAGVSTATVSRTFRTPDLLNQQTRRRVLDVAATLNYQPRRQSVKVAADSAPASAADMPNALGFLFFASENDSSQINEFYAPILVGAQAEAGRLGMHLIVRTTSRYQSPDVMPQMFREQAVAGMLLVGAALPGVLETFADHLPPSVLVDNWDAHGRHDCLLTDGFGGVLAATRYLLDLGHRRIGFVLNESTAPSFQERQRGYLCALWEAGISPERRWVLTAPRSEIIKPYIEPLLTAPDRPTAIIAANDFIALSVLTASRALGLVVPDDLSLIGFDDTPYSFHAYPPLTTMRVNKEHLGRLAVRQLLSRIEEAQSGRAPEPAVHLVAPVTLVRRESCASPKPQV